MILVVCALPQELPGFEAGPDIEVYACGVGPVEAAAATARKLAHGTYAAVVNAGIAGAFRGSARVGEARIVTDEALAGLGLEGGGAFSLPGGAKLVAGVSADPGLLRRCADAFERARGVTVAQVTATDATANALRARYAADVESMEGFAVLRAAALAGVPALEVRGISNYVGARAHAEWDFAAGARATVVALESVLECIVRRV